MNDLFYGPVAAFEGWRVAVVHLSFAGLLGMLLLNLLLIWFRKIPFTCSYFPAKMNMAVMFGVYMGAFTTYCWTMADLVVHVAEVYLHKVTLMRTGEVPAQWPPRICCKPA